MTVHWEYRDSSTLTKSVPTKTSLPDVSGAYGIKVFFDNEEPGWDEDITAFGMTLTELRTEQGKLNTRNTPAAYTMVTGEVVTGFPTSVGGKRILGTTLFEVDVKVLRTDKKAILG